MTDRRTLVADTALDLVATRGLKGLTHRAVDEAAGLPTGTTSNHFRTRAALVAAVVDRIEQRDLEVWASDGREAPTNADDLAGRLAGYLAVFVRGHAGLTRARLAVSLAEPAAVAAGHARFLAIARTMLVHAGIDDPEVRARWIADQCDGLLLHQLTVRAGEPVDEPAAARAIRALLG
ncbi:TetR/AcrR family transcriptional regulator [Agromyces sp. MMS24-JH15]|uniref:TetR/AcrR family transcriptional regulator n=1 Tax=Agromyces sp. MMS24-JH15 TaxID=3243765 RepID=UPI00374A8006